MRFVLKVNGAEAGLAGVVVRLTDAPGNTVYADTVTDTDGNKTVEPGGVVYFPPPSRPPPSVK